MNLVLAFTLPIIAGMIGWFTNYLAVKMLFHPREAKKFLGITFHGVFPKRQAHVADKVGQLVARELLASEDIFNKINNPENFARIHEKLERKLEDYFDVTLVEKYPLASKFLPNKAKIKIQTEILNEIESYVPILINSQIRILEEKLDIEAMISTKVNQLSSQKLEEVIWNILATEFKFIEYVGAVLGFTIGLIQVLLAYFLL